MLIDLNPKQYIRSAEGVIKQATESYHWMAVIQDLEEKYIQYLENESDSKEKLVFKLDLLIPEIREAFFSWAKEQGDTELKCGDVTYINVASTVIRIREAFNANDGAFDKKTKKREMTSVLCKAILHRPPGNREEIVRNAIAEGADAKTLVANKSTLLQKELSVRDCSIEVVEALCRVVDISNVNGDALNALDMVENNIEATVGAQVSQERWKDIRSILLAYGAKRTPDIKSLMG